MSDKRLDNIESDIEKIGQWFLRLNNESKVHSAILAVLSRKYLNEDDRAIVKGIIDDSHASLVEKGEDLDIHESNYEDSIKHLNLLLGSIKKS
ncbi:hypothetical protein ACBQ54_00345 [Providencia vermicola]|uniref:hypothetical protein n=1 Tax=Providencia vermicola TaxID=333965 RepID=UPI003523372A